MQLSGAALVSSAAAFRLVPLAVVTPCLHATSLLAKGRTQRHVAWAKRDGRKDEPALSATEAAALVPLLKPSWVDLLAGAVTASPKRRAAAVQAPSPPDWSSPIYTLIATQAFICTCCHALHVLPATALGLSLKSPRWWQLVSSGFAFTHWQHLAETVFLSYVLGRVLERRHGSWGVWGAYLASIIGASTFAVWLLPSSRLIPPCFATSAGVFGLFVCGLLLPRLLTKPLEVACLSPFLVSATISHYQPLATYVVLQGVTVGHLVPLAGAFVGASIVWAILGALDTYKARIEREQAAREQQLRAQRQQEEATALAQALGGAAKAATDVAKKLF